VRKDAVLGLFELGVDASLAPPLHAIFDRLSLAVPQFYGGGGFPWISFLALDKIHDALGPRYGVEDYDVLEAFRHAVPPGFDLVLSLHAGGNEAAFVAAAALRAPLALGFYQYKEVATEYRGFRHVELGQALGLDGRRVLVVDDVVKTGRSMGQAFRWLLDHGVAAVEGVGARRFLSYDVERCGIRAASDPPFIRYVPATNIRSVT
jgi:hypothetical protein